VEGKATGLGIAGRVVVGKFIVAISVMTEVNLRSWLLPSSSLQPFSSSQVRDLRGQLQALFFARFAQFIIHKHHLGQIRSLQRSVLSSFIVAY
jgi:hypothetical protein